MSRENPQDNVPLWAEARGWDAEKLAIEADRARRFGLRVGYISIIVSVVLTIGVLIAVVSMQLFPQSYEGWKGFGLVVFAPVTLWFLIRRARQEQRENESPSPFIDGFGTECVAAVLVCGAVLGVQVWQSCEILLPGLGG